MIGRRCRGSCLCSTPGSRGGICRSSSASVPARPVIGGWIEWQQAGVWERLHALLLAELQAAGEIEWSRAVVDSQSRAGEKGGSETGPSPVDRGRAGSKHHLLVDATGIPLAWSVTGGNRNDVTQLIPLLDRVPAVRGKVGRPRRRPERVTADRGYDHDKHRRQLRERGIRPEIARRKTEHGSGLGRVRWVVERTFAWLHKLQATPRPLRPPRRDPRSLPRDRLLPRLLQETPELIVIRSLRGPNSMTSPAVASR